MLTGLPEGGYLNRAGPGNTIKGGVVYQTHAKTSGIQDIDMPPGADADIGNATTVLLTERCQVFPALPHHGPGSAGTAISRRRSS